MELLILVLELTTAVVGLLGATVSLIAVMCDKHVDYKKKRR